MSEAGQGAPRPDPKRTGPGIHAGGVPQTPPDPPVPVPPEVPPQPLPEVPPPPIKEPDPTPIPAGDPPSDPPLRAAAQVREVGGPTGPEPTRYGDWERKGRVSDF